MGERKEKSEKALEERKVGCVVPALFLRGGRESRFGLLQVSGDVALNKRLRCRLIWMTLGWTRDDQTRLRVHRSSGAAG